jgi:hypothetical protein
LTMRPSLPVCPDERTFTVPACMSQKCQYGADRQVFVCYMLAITFGANGCMILSSRGIVRDI